MASKKIVVTLNHILFDDTGSGAGDDVAVFGRFDVGHMTPDPNLGQGKTMEEILASLVPVAAFNLFDRSSEDAQSIAKGTPFVIDNRAELDIPEGDFMQIAGHLAKRGAGGDVDDFPFDMRTPFDLVGFDVLNLGPFFAETGEPVTVKISVELVNPA
jgi:hypothetical protein